MKKIKFLLFSLASSFFFSQQVGDVVNFEQKLDLTPQGVLNFISNNLGEQNAPNFIDYLSAFNVGLKAYKITYYTKNENNNLVKATGLVMYPNVNYKLSTVVSNHGTTDSRYNVPSNLKGILSAGFVVELSYVLNGYILMAPDYVGMGTGDGAHPYIHYPSEAHATIDFVTAANKVLSQLGVQRYDEYFLAGYSQGAHAAMATLKKLNTSNPTQLAFKYAYMGNGPYDFSGVTLEKGVLEKDVFPFSSFIANIVNTCNKTGYATYNTDISEVISADYMDKYNHHVIQDNGGVLWGPIFWRELFTSNFINDVTNNQNNKLRQCLRSNDVYDWHNKTPMTLGHSTVDLIIHPDNTSKTIDVQRGYYSFWDLDRFKLDSFYWGPLGHVGSIVPFLLASNAKFNMLRSGGFFNQWAMLASKNIEKAAAIPYDYTSQIKPELPGMKIIEITDFNKNKNENMKVPHTDLSALGDGIYLLKILENNKTKLIPYIKNNPHTIPQNEIIKSENNNIIELKIDKQELFTIYIFDQNKKLIQSVSKEKYIEEGGINVNSLENKNYIFEVITPYYNLQFNKQIHIDHNIYSDNIDVFTENSQIFIKSTDRKIKKVTVYNMLGKSIQDGESNESFYQSKNLTSGVYIVQILQTDGKIMNKKVKMQ
ncbi:T9SS type A sorting domain-containing protein [Chryseobacterium potabilaquae]|uniref:Por secretion system C-terminal sorting domain-containing protein n=1 Tax=Chryseobacterium potabilaquae TaxID=2675057 RepID=A0A6N4X7Z6_9FLAO|nr:T9SS type A sorting domain-containing protein [Chryseobacterium potabilaquae]CAA7197225.1 hypothetical protein CHRY9293_03278 [Chryseobacterium potabilaquae]